jgi:hypothetical protein
MLRSSSKLSLPFRFSDQIFISTSHSFHACYIPCTSHPPWFDHLNNVWWRVQIKLLIVQFSPYSLLEIMFLRSLFTQKELHNYLPRLWNVFWDTTCMMECWKGRNFIVTNYKYQVLGCYACGVMVSAFGGICCLHVQGATTQKT